MSDLKDIFVHKRQRRGNPCRCFLAILGIRSALTSTKEKIGPVVPDTILRSRKHTNEIEYSKIGLEILRKLVLYWKR